MNIYDFKISIKAKKAPVNINNKIIIYTQDVTMQNNHLFCEIFFKETLIAQGIILDFYKEFEILDFNQQTFTQIKTFELNGATYTKNTYYGQKIFEIKNFKNPPIDDKVKESYINEIVSVFNGYIEYLKKDIQNLNITYIPSSSKIPEDIAYKLSKINQVTLKDVIKKNHLVQSKSMTDLSTQSLNKYTTNISELDASNKFILIDDVVGTGASLCEILYNLYYFNKKANFFFIPVKDVKR